MSTHLFSNGNSTKLIRMKCTNNGFTNILNNIFTILEENNAYIDTVTDTFSNIIIKAAEEAIGLSFSNQFLDGIINVKKPFEIKINLQLF